MKFSDFDEHSWNENRQFFDTCLIPFTGLKGSESPLEAARALERLRDFLDMIEKPFQGRVVTYPALQYSGEGFIGLLNDICHKVKSNGFQYAIVLTADIHVSQTELFESDLVLSMPVIEELHGSRINIVASGKILEMWQNSKDLKCDEKSTI